MQIKPDYTGARLMMCWMPNVHLFANDAQHSQRRHAPGDVMINNLPGAVCWPETPGAPEADAAPVAAPELEATDIMLCIISGDMLDIMELMLFSISGEICMPAAGTVWCIRRLSRKQAQHELMETEYDISWINQTQHMQLRRMLAQSTNDMSNMDVDTVCLSMYQSEHVNIKHVLSVNSSIPSILQWAIRLFNSAKADLERQPF